MVFASNVLLCIALNAKTMASAKNVKMAFILTIKVYANRAVFPIVPSVMLMVLAKNVMKAIIMTTLKAA